MAKLLLETFFCPQKAFDHENISLPEIIVQGTLDLRSDLFFIIFFNRFVGFCRVMLFCF